MPAFPPLPTPPADPPPPPPPPCWAQIEGSGLVTAYGIVQPAALATHLALPGVVAITSDQLVILRAGGAWVLQDGTLTAA
ncbi:hypothetical protein [Limobrevibacterium gyesilva]|uniref:Uncharacterized protein n=1 Tax=Limobrevibacterium gyesilva TaxID=2991712 RepID=A0AA41YS76_9PROT|nr:hypothetical protein [Limobrevibacterium gyesilva]MCW3477373.1 hypothetical protein [Limobrevibacterium gyesilva]